MLKKSTVILPILALLAFGACTCWGYTVTQWPAPGIPNTTFGPGSAVLGNAGYGEYGAYGAYGAYGGYGYPGYYGGHYGAYGRGYDGRGWGH